MIYNLFCIWPLNSWAHLSLVELFITSIFKISNSLIINEKNIIFEYSSTDNIGEISVSDMSISEESIYLNKYKNQNEHILSFKHKRSLK